MSNHLTTGSLGEQLATEYLLSNGYSLIDRNFRTAFGEIDIIARDPDGVLVIVEVKTLRAAGSITPEDNLTRSKLSKLSRIALFYANKNHDIIFPDQGFRLDLIAIVLDPLPDTPSIQKFGETIFAVSHHKNIFL